jgi:hypothetical protein
MRRFHGLGLLIAGFLCSVISFRAASQESFPITPVQRLFTVPTGRILGSYEVLLTLGGAYGAMNKGEYLGIASVGLGNVAEVEISTWRMVSNLFQGTTALGTTALKVGLLHENGSASRPDVAMIFRLNPSWSEVKSNDRKFLAEVEGQVSEIHFKMHIASLYLSVSKSLSPALALHAGAFLMDVRTKEGSVSFPDAPYAPLSIPDFRKNLVSGFFGFESQVNDRTFILGEVTGSPRYNYHVGSNTMSVDQVATVIAGVRFYFASRISADAGVKYRSDYLGIADADIAVGLNAGINLYDLVTGKKMNP